MSKSRSKYLKKHKFRGNQYSKKHTRVSKSDGFPSTADINTRNSASGWKIPLPKQSKSPDCGISSTDPSITGFCPVRSPLNAGNFARANSLTERMCQPSSIVLYFVWLGEGCFYAT